MILFLDYDGVLHPDPCTDPARLFENAARLRDVLENFPEVGVVLSTSWRNVRTAKEIIDPLPDELRQRILGINPNFSEFTVSARRMPYRRHAECEEWLRRHRMSDSPWWALDDRPEWFAPYCENLLECDPRCGFNARVAARLRSVLAMARMRAVEDVDLILA